MKTYTQRNPSSLLETLSNKYPVPFLDLKALHERYTDEFAEISRRVVADAAFVGGGAVSEFEQAFARYCEADHCVGCANGTDAIELILRGYGIGPGDEVILPANTFYATLEAVEAVGARAVLVDCELLSWQIDPAEVEKAVTNRTAAIIAVHLYGHPAPMTELSAIARCHGLKLIEDAAQAHGARLNGRRVGSLGDAAAFSFYPGKNLGACGDGGAVTSNDQVLAARIRMLSTHGQSKKYHHEVIGRNSRLDALQAAFLSRKLVDLDDQNDKRRAAAEQYERGLDQIGLKLVAPVTAPAAEAVHHLYVIHIRDREVLMAKLEDAGIHTAMHYPVPCHLQAGSAHLRYRKGDFPAAEFNAEYCVSLPMFPDITEGQVRRVVAAIKGVLSDHQIGEVSLAA